MGGVISSVVVASLSTLVASPSLSIPALLILSVLALVSYPYLVNWKYRKAVMKLPGPPLHDPILGNIPDLQQRPRVPALTQRALKYGRDQIHRIIAGPLPLVFVVGPDAAREILGSSKHTQKSAFYNLFKPYIGGDALLVSWGDTWKARRRMVTPAFHFEVLKRFMEVMNEQGDIFVSQLEKKVEEKEFDIFPMITNCALDIICETAMGKKLNAQTTGKVPFIEAVYYLLEEFIRRMERPWLQSDFVYDLTPGGRKAKKMLKILHDFDLEVIRERKALLEKEKGDENAEKKRKLAFLDLLLSSELDGKPLTEQQIREEVDTFMVAGHDTTTASMGWTMYYLGQNPEIQRKAQEEIDQVVGDEQVVTSEMIGQLKYLDMIIRETMRIAPSIPWIGRVTTEDIQFKQYFLPKGTNVIVSIIAIHRNPDFWENPFEFNPDRWLNTEGMDAYAHVPFSAGPRNCIGQKFALTEEKILLSKILRRFTLETKRETGMNPILILRPENGVWVNLKKRV